MTERCKFWPRVNPPAPAQYSPSPPVRGERAGVRGRRLPGGMRAKGARDLRTRFSRHEILAAIPTEQRILQQRPPHPDPLPPFGGPGRQ